MGDEQVGVVIKYFGKVGVAAVEVMGPGIKKGDLLHFKGSTTDFKEEVVSMEVDNQPRDEAAVGDMVGIKVGDRVRENDKIYVVSE